MLIVRIVVGLVWGLFVLPFVALCSLFVNPNREYEKESKFYRRLLEVSTAWALFGLGVRVRVEGEEKLPEGRFLFVSNHRSSYDPILMWHVFRGRQLVFVTKPENFGVFAYGRIIHRLRFLGIDRENARRAIRTVYRAADLLKQDEATVGVYPEGKRSKSLKLLEFHGGVFKIAQKAKVPVVVLTVEGTEFIHKNVVLRPTDVVFRIHSVRSAEEVSSLRCEELSESVREEMLSYLGE